MNVFKLVMVEYSTTILYIYLFSKKWLQYPVFILKFALMHQNQQIPTIKANFWQLVKQKILNKFHKGRGNAMQPFDKGTGLWYGMILK